MRAVASPGRWVWRVSGLATAAALVVGGAYLITSAGQAGNGQPMTTVTRAVTVPQPVTSLTVQSYGAPVQVTAAAVRHVQITETLMYAARARGAATVVHVAPAPPPVPGASVSASPSAVPAAPTGSLSDSPSAASSAAGGPAPGVAPAVVQSVSGGHLNLGDPACANSNCSVSFAVTVPADVTAIVSTEGGSVSVSGIAGANLESDGGPVSATKIGGPLTVITGGGSLQLDGLTGPLSVDTGSGSLTAHGLTAATATVITNGGDAWLAFSAAPDTVTVSTDGGNAQLTVPAGPYALTVDSGGGPQPSVGIPADPQAHRSITVISGGGSLWIEPAA
jgi:hypothetical protein